MKYDKKQFERFAMGGWLMKYDKKREDG